MNLETFLNFGKSPCKAKLRNLCLSLCFDSIWNLSTKAFLGPNGDLKIWGLNNNIMKIQLNPIISSRMTFFFVGIPDSMGFCGIWRARIFQFSPTQSPPEQLLSPMSLSPERLQGRSQDVFAKINPKHENTSKDFNSDPSKWSHSKRKLFHPWPCWTFTFRLSGWEQVHVWFHQVVANGFLPRKIQGLVSEPQWPIPSIPTLIAYTQTDEGQ